MLAFHNHVQLVGRCGHEAEITALSDGTHVARLRLYQSTRSDSDHRPLVFKLKAWDGVARALHREVRRGDRLLVQGKLVNRIREYDGQPVAQTEIHVSYFSVLANRHRGAKEEAEGFTNKISF